MFQDSCSLYSDSERENEQQPPPVPHKLSLIDLARRRRHRVLGEYGVAAEQMTIHKSLLRKQNYSVSLISALSQDKIIAN